MAVNTLSTGDTGMGHDKIQTPYNFTTNTLSPTNMGVRGGAGTIVPTSGQTYPRSQG